MTQEMDGVWLAREFMAGGSSGGLGKDIFRLLESAGAIQCPQKSPRGGAGGLF
jgi:hypothetical protein